MAARRSCGPSPTGGGEDKAETAVAQQALDLSKLLGALEPEEKPDGIGMTPAEIRSYSILRAIGESHDAAHAIGYPVIGIRSFVERGTRIHRAVLLGSDYYAPSDSCEAIGPFVGLSLPYSPLPFACLTGLPCSQ
jgi:hypothetical protein